MQIRRRLLAITLLTACAASAHAAGINLSWDDCGSFGTESRTFACDTNVGTHVLVGSFVAPPGLQAVSGNSAIIDVFSTCNNIFPHWWNMRTGGCRAPSSLISNFDFTGGPGNCHDYWQGGAIGGIAMDPPAGSHTAIRLQCALPAGDPRIGPIAEGTEVYSFKVIINNARTVGLGACTGCQDGACLLLRSIALFVPGGNITLASPATRAHVTWQSATLGTTPFGPVCFGDCPTPTRAPTWGQIKSLYR